MRRFLALILVGLAATSGCGGPHQDVRVYSSVPIETPQQRLDDVAAGLLGRLSGGIF